MNQTRITAEPGQHALTITRDFDAPPELVFKAHVDPELYARWLGPRSHPVVLDRFEPRAGGSYRYHVDGAGPEVAFNDVFHEVTAPERIISTFEFEAVPEPGHAGMSGATFEALPGGRTRLTTVEVYLLVADRDAALQSGMESGVVEGYERLDEILEGLAEKA